ncbi:MAG: HAMP domain-containing protein [bacterium]|nr:HAMP domain-containing protein [bacterium]
MLKSPLFLRVTLWALLAGGLLTVASLWLFGRIVADRVVKTVGEELVTSQRVLRNLLDQQQEFLHAVAVNQAEYLATLDLNKSAQDAEEWGRNFLDLTMLDVLQVEDSNGNALVRVVRETSHAVPDTELLDLGGLRFQHDGLYLYQIASAELSTPDKRRVFVGNRLDARWLWGISEITRSRMAVFTGQQFLFVSVDSTLIQPLKESLPWDMTAATRPIPLDLEEHRHLVMCEGLPGGPSPDMCVLLVRDLGPELSVLRDVQTSVGALAAIIVLTVTVIGGIAISRMIARIRRLNQAALALETGAADAALEERGGDELASLTKQFIEMRARLRERQCELERLNTRLLQQMNELKLTQRQLVQSEKFSTVGKLSAQLSHELNNPICNIQNCVEVLGKPSISKAESGEYVQLIRDEVSRMAKLTRQLLDFHRPSQEEFRPTDMNSIADSVLRISTLQLESKRVAVQREFADGLPQLWGDGDQLKQVLLNLVLNAIDAMPGGGTLTLRTSADSEHVVLEAADTGIGMDEATLEKIFNAFFTTKSEVAGVGLGLFVCYRVVRLHGGLIDVTSAPGEGTTFTMKLPIRPAHVSTDEGASV